jgi:hypothetical protein
MSCIDPEVNYVKGLSLAQCADTNLYARARCYRWLIVQQQMATGRQAPGEAVHHVAAQEVVNRTAAADSYHNGINF